MKTLTNSRFKSLALCAFLTALLLNWNATTLKAQTTIGGGVEVAVPLFKHSTNMQLLGNIASIPVDLSSNTNPGFGFSGRLQQQLTDKIALNAKFGYISWQNENFGNLGAVGDVIGNLTNLKASVTAIPIQGGIKYYIADGFYAMADAGVHFITTKLDANFIVNVSAKETTTALSFAPGIGYEIPLGKASLDLGARYNYASNGFSYMGISAAIGLPIGR